MKYNRVTLYGIAAASPTIIKDEEGEYKKGFLPISVIKSTRYTGELSTLLQQNVPIIMSKNPAIIEEMAKIERYDSVYVKGVLTTSATKKSAKCTDCGAIQQKDGVIGYITPVHCTITKRNGDQKTAAEDLFKNREISNEIQLIGNVCADPERVPVAAKILVVQYQLAITRTYRVDEEKTDFPWIKVFADNAKEDLKRIRTGSKVLVDGCLQARNTPRHDICERCGKAFEWSDFEMEVVPYETEYLANYVTDEDLGIASGES